jgi:WhiB family redox-sensing transcriptional regulator
MVAPTAAWRLSHVMEPYEWAGTLARFWSWRERARCRGLDPSIFFSPEGERGRARRERERAAKVLCATCVVQQACASYAIANREPFGVWGGLSESERDAIWRRLDTGDAESEEEPSSSMP